MSTAMMRLPLPRFQASARGSDADADFQFGLRIRSQHGAPCFSQHAELGPSAASCESDRRGRLNFYSSALRQPVTIVAPGDDSRRCAKRSRPCSWLEERKNSPTAPRSCPRGNRPLAEVQLLELHRRGNPRVVRWNSDLRGLNVLPLFRQDRYGKGRRAASTPALITSSSANWGSRCDARHTTFRQRAKHPPVRTATPARRNLCPASRVCAGAARAGSGAARRARRPRRRPFRRRIRSRGAGPA